MAPGVLDKLKPGFTLSRGSCWGEGECGRRVGRWCGLEGAGRGRPRPSGQRGMWPASASRQRRRRHRRPPHCRLPPLRPLLPPSEIPSRVRPSPQTSPARFAPHAWGPLCDFPLKTFPKHPFTPQESRPQPREGGTRLAEGRPPRDGFLGGDTRTVTQQGTAPCSMAVSRGDDGEGAWAAAPAPVLGGQGVWGRASSWREKEQARTGSGAGRAAAGGPHGRPPWEAFEPCAKKPPKPLAAGL